MTLRLSGGNGRAWSRRRHNRISPPGHANYTASIILRSLIFHVVRYAACAPYSGFTLPQSAPSQRPCMSRVIVMLPEPLFTFMVMVPLTSSRLTACKR
jgi:hypothetical protein